MLFGGDDNEGGIPMRTHRFCVVGEDVNEFSEIRNDSSELLPSINYQQQPQPPTTITLADEIDSRASNAPSL